jgi:hypothetical protein
MNLSQQYHYRMKTYSYIGAYITHFCGDHQERLHYWSGKQLPDDGFPIEHDSILLPLVHEPHNDHLLDPSYNVLTDTQADRDNMCIDPDQPPVWKVVVVLQTWTTN